MAMTMRGLYSCWRLFIRLLINGALSVATHCCGVELIPEFKTTGQLGLRFAFPGAEAAGV